MTFSTAAGHIYIASHLCVFCDAEQDHLFEQNFYHTPQSSYWNDFSSMCVFWRDVSLLLRTKVLSQWPHLNGSFPLCILWWLISSLLITKVLSQRSQLNGISHLSFITNQNKELSSKTKQFRKWKLGLLECDILKILTFPKISAF